MQPGQLSIWLTLVPAILAGTFGILGVVVGQVINARRERIREDTRWKRDQEREQAKTAQAMLDYWRDKRLEVYLEFIAAVQTLDRNAHRLLIETEEGYVGDDNLPTTVDQNQLAVQDAQTRHILLAAPEVTMSTPPFFTKLAKFVAGVVNANARMAEGEQITQEEIQGLHDVDREYRNAFNEYLAVIRRTIGVDHPEIHYMMNGLPIDGLPLPVNPSPPSGTTS